MAGSETPEAIVEASPDAPPPLPVRTRRRWLRRVRQLVLWTAAFLLFLGLAGTLAVAWLDTDPGRHWVARQLETLDTRSGFAVRVGGFRGSLFGHLTAVDVSLYDPKGRWAHIPSVSMRWWPWDLMQRRVNIGTLRAPTVIIERRPEFRPTGEDRPLLPDIDITIRRLRVGQLILEEGAAGERYVLTANGRLHLTRRTATALLNLGGAASGDRLALAVTIAPEDDVLDLNAHVNAPTGGALAGYLGTRHGFTFSLRGDGTWARWRGAVDASYGDAPLLALALAADDGHFRLNGDVLPAPDLPLLLRRLLATGGAVDLDATARKGTVDTRLSLRSDVIAVEGAGRVEIRSGRLHDAHATARLGDIADLVPGIRSAPITARLTAEGLVQHPKLEIVGRSDALHLGRRISLSGLSLTLRPEGGSLAAMPVEARVTRVTGVGDILGQRLSGATVTGRITAALPGPRLTLEQGVLRGPNARSALEGFVDFRSQEYRLALDGALERIEFPTITRGTLTLKLVVAGRDFASRTTLAGVAETRPLEPLSRPVRALIGADTRLSSRIARGQDGVFRLEDLRLAGKTLQLQGFFNIAPGGGVSGRMSGPLYALAGASQVLTARDPAQLVLTASGTLPDYRIDLDARLAEAALGPGQLTGLRLAGRSERLERFHFALSGASALGPLSGATDMTVRGGVTLDNVNFQLGNIGLSGVLHQAPGQAWSGRLALAGGGLSGRVTLPGGPGVTLADIDITGRSVRLGEPATRLFVDRLAARGQLRLAPDDPGFTGSFRASQVATATLRLEQLALTSLRQGDGSRLRLTLKGERGAPFDFDGTADLTPGTVRVTGAGQIAGAPVRLSRPADFAIAPGGGWLLSPTELAFGQGTLGVEAVWTPHRRRVNATARQISALALELVRPGTGIDGRLSGSAAYAWEEGRLPTATADLTIQDLHRASLIGRSAPVGMRVRAQLDGPRAEATLTATENGQTSGTVRLALAPLEYQGGSPVPVNWRNVPLSGNISWNGRADALWALTGIETHEVSGPAIIRARLGGTLGDPDIAGNIRSTGASYENLATGLRVTNVDLEAVFRGPRLDIVRLGGTAGRNGRVSATGWLELSSARGFPADVQLTFDRAAIMRRDDIQASATGKARLTHGPEGGLIEGRLRVTQARIRMGGEAAANPVPRIAYEEVGALAFSQPLATRAPVLQPFRMALDITAPEEVMLEGMGLHSEWRGQLNITGTTATPLLAGRLDLVRGTYEFSGRDFDLDRGQIILRGETPPDPILDIVATHALDNVTVMIEIRGTARKPEVSFTSTPRLPQEEVLSRLLFGASVPNLSATEAVQLGAALAALREGNADLNIIGRVGKAVGIDRLRVMPGDQDKGIGTVFSGGKYITNKIYLEVATDGRGYTATLVEIDLTRTLSLLSQVATLGSTNVSLKWSRDY